ncbi:MAG: hypothetical protein FWF36_06240 [Propionibacteriaceae bacterium]|nr:hypothetical protein [Propionibacteriaceae bacterium]
MKHVGVLPAAMILAAGLLAGLAPASANAPDPIALAWDAPASSMVWVPGQSASAMGSFVGSPVVVPGDHSERTLHVRNDGPSAATAVVQIVDVSASGASDSVNSDLGSLLHLTWQTGGTGADMTWRQAMEAGDPTWSVQFDVEQGAEFSVTAGYYFPIGSTTGQAGGHSSYVMSFNVRITLTEKVGATPPTVGRDPSSTPPVPPTGPGAATGGILMSFGPWGGWAPTLLATALLAGALAWRRRSQSQGGPQSKIG